MDHERYVTHHSWGSRLRGSACGAVAGVLFFAGSFALLGWNEGRAVAETRALNECAGAVRHVGCDAPPSDDGALVHASCALTDVPTLLDGRFGAQARTPVLLRSVTALQWRETDDEHCRKNKLGGGSTCTHDVTYSLDWTSSPISSAGFRSQAGHGNGAWAAESATFAPPALHAGALLLPPALQARLAAGPLPPLPFANTTLACGGADASSCGWQVDGQNGLYYHAGGSPGAAPTSGDLRVSWAASAVDAVSVIGVQSRGPDGNATLAPYFARSGHSCFLLEPGLLPPEAMIAAAKARNAAATWILRALGCVANFLGIRLFLQPLGVALDVVPFLGPFMSDVLEFGVGIAAALLSLTLCAFTIAVAWIAVRPAVGVPLLLLSMAATGALVAARERRRRAGGGRVAPGAAGEYSAELNELPA